MKESGIFTVRIAEFAWQIFEPEEGKYSYEFFDEFLDLAEEEEMKVIFGTPTAIPPVWMSEKYPEILNCRKDGVLFRHGMRRHYNYNSRKLHELVRDAVEHIASHYAKRSCIVGWQIDNEINCEINEFYSESDTIAFRDFLKRKYGTLEKLSLNILYAFRKKPKLLLYVLFFANLFMAAMGVGNMPVVAMFAPIMIMICYKTGIDFLIGAIAINSGSIAGANFMTSVNGVVFRNLMDSVGFEDESFTYSAIIFIITIILPLIIITAYTLLNRKKMSELTEVALEKPEPFTSVQMKNLGLMGVMLVVVLVIPILDNLMPDVTWIAFINSRHI